MVSSGTDRHRNLFLKETNAMHEDITFTVEKGNKTINYLDLTLTVNCKGSATKSCMDTIIPEDSFHHLKQKMAAKIKGKMKSSPVTDCWDQWVSVRRDEQSHREF